MQRSKIGRVLVVLSLVVAVAACGGDDDDEAGGVSATLADFSIDLSASSEPAGEVTFDVENTAQQVHEFVVAKTDLDAADLPTGEDGDVSEEGAEDLEVVDEIEDIEGGDDAALTVNLEPGHYVIFCNLPGHYRQGMHTDFEVTSGS